jgi:hypothetical protein
MKPRRTILSNAVFSLPGGNEDNDLWVMRDEHADGSPLVRSCWVPDDEERKAIADGANIELIVWGAGHPPVAMGVVHYPLGAPPDDERDGTAAS